MQSKPSVWLVYALLLLTTLFWSSNIVIGRAFQSDISPIQLSYWRWLVASLIILPLTLSKLKQDWPLIKANWGILALLSTLGVSLFNSILYYSAHSTSATNIGLIQTTLPLFVVLLNYLLFRQRVNAGTLAGVALGLAGAVFVIIKGSISDILGIHLALGDLLMLFAMLCYALYSVLLPKAPAIHPYSLLAVTIILGSILLLPFVLIDIGYESISKIHPNLLAVILYIAVFPSIIAYWVWTLGVKVIGAANTGLFICFLPIFTALLAAFFLHESLRYFHVVGLVLVSSGVLVVHYFRNAPSSR